MASMSVLRSCQMPYCQLVGREVSPEICKESQGNSGCFGCAAPTRRCESCSLQYVTVPAVGLCNDCIVNLLALERDSNHESVGLCATEYCQILKKKITSELCVVIQKQPDCRNCPVTFRMCEKCEQQKVRFSAYGLCLKCAIDEYGDDWQPPIHSERNLIENSLQCDQEKIGNNGHMEGHSGISISPQQLTRQQEKLKKIAHVCKKIGLLAQVLSNAILDLCDDEEGYDGVESYDLERAILKLVRQMVISGRKSITMKDIVDGLIGSGFSGAQFLTARYIGKIVTKNLKINTARRAGGCFSILLRLEMPKLEQLYKEYGIVPDTSEV